MSNVVTDTHALIWYEALATIPRNNVSDLADLSKIYVKISSNYDKNNTYFSG